MKLKKNYYTDKFYKIFGINIPIIIGFLISLIISIILFLILNLKNNFFLIFRTIFCFIGLLLSGIILNKKCTNIDKEKCKRCRLWNCLRVIEKGDK